jgi:hypothetical protein
MDGLKQWLLRMVKAQHLRHVGPAMDLAALAPRYRCHPARGILEIPRISAANVGAFESYVTANLPVVIEGGLSVEWRDRWSLGTMRKVAGHREITGRTVDARQPATSGTETVHIFGDVEDPLIYSNCRLGLGEYLTTIEEEAASPQSYAARVNVKADLPELADAVGAAIRLPAGLDGVFGSEFQDNPLMYLGGGCNATPCHFDLLENMLCVVQGVKHVTLFHPADSMWLYPTQHATSIYSSVNTHKPDEHAHPMYGHAKPLKASVAAGEILYIPCCWWHALTAGPGANMVLGHFFRLSDQKVDHALASHSHLYSGAVQ